MDPSLYQRPRIGHAVEDSRPLRQRSMCEGPEYIFRHTNAPDLTNSGSDAGVRKGDPISIVLASRRLTSARSGIIIPAGPGKPLEVTVPETTTQLLPSAAANAAVQ